MAFFFSKLPEIWPWLILIAAQMAALTSQRWLATVLLGLFVGVALTMDLLTPIAALFVALGLTLAARLPALSGRAAWLWHLAFVTWSVALGAHLWPGFHNLLVLDQVRAGPGSAPFSMYLNLDKPMVLFAVLLACPAILGHQRTIRPATLLAGLAVLPALFAVGVLSGAVKPEWTIPPWWLVFALSNLFLTCLTEEVFFRGYLQTKLAARFGPGVGLGLASILFGLAHFAGGAALVVFAALLGLACGLGYLATGRLWVPVLMHFGFNLTHLILFTYPAPV